MEGWQIGERPKEQGRYMLTYKDAFGRNAITIADRFYDDAWHWYLIMSNCVMNEKKVVAWQKFPEPYQG